MMGAQYLALLPILILAVAGMAVMLLEPFTAPESKNRLARLAVIAFTKTS